MNPVSGNTAGLFHAQPVWAATDDGAANDPIKIVVDQLMAERIDEAASDRAARRPRARAPVRSRLGHVITGLGERIAGERPVAPAG